MGYNAHIEQNNKARGGFFICLANIKLIKDLSDKFKISFTLNLYDYLIAIKL